MLDGVARPEAELVDATARIPAARAELDQDLAEAGPRRAALPPAGGPGRGRDHRGRPGRGRRRGRTRSRALRLLDEAGRALEHGLAEARAGAGPRPAARPPRSTRPCSPPARPSPRRRTSSPPGAARSAVRRAPASPRPSGTCSWPPAATTRSPRSGEAQQADALAQAGTAARPLRRGSQWSGRRTSAASAAVALAGDLGSLVLGGILSGGGGGYRGSRGRGIGNRRGPGSFGGSSRRGRRGGGGRF